MTRFDTAISHVPTIHTGGVGRWSDHSVHILGLCELWCDPSVLSPATQQDMSLAAFSNLVPAVWHLPEPDSLVFAGDALHENAIIAVLLLGTAYTHGHPCGPIACPVGMSNGSDAQCLLPGLYTVWHARVHSLSGCCASTGGGRLNAFRDVPTMGGVGTASQYQTHTPSITITGRHCQCGPGTWILGSSTLLFYPRAPTTLVCVKTVV